jgi:hypothetical protein
MTDRLIANQALGIDAFLEATESPVRLVMQGDNNLVLYLTDVRPWRALWASNTWRKGSERAVMQPDGNFVLYDSRGRAQWSSRTWGNPGAWLLLQNDGNLVLYNAQNRPLWATNTVQRDFVSGWQDGALLQAIGDAKVYVVENGKRRLIPDPQTFEARGYRWEDIHHLTQGTLERVPLGDPLAHVERFIIRTGNQHLGRNRWMNTECGISLATGHVAGKTRTWAATWFGGFHGGVAVIPADADGLPLAGKIYNRYGVDGTAIGSHDRTDSWFAQIDPEKAKLTYHVWCFHTHDPDSFQTKLDQWVAAGKKVGELADSVGSIAKVVAAIGA